MSSMMPRRLASLAAAALVVATVTCVDRPTEPRETVARVPTAPVSAATGITHTLLTAGNSTVDQQVCTTPSITPAANALVTVAVLAHNTGSAAPSPKVTGGGMTAWTQVKTLAFDNNTSPHKRLSLFRALSAAPGSGPVKITFTTPQANCQWAVAQWQGVVTTGTNGSDAVLQSATARGENVAGRTVTLNSFANPGNVSFGVFGVARNTVGITPGSGFTETTEQPSGETPFSDLQTEWSAGDNTINANWAQANAGAIGLEIRAGVPPDPVASVEVSPATASIAAGTTVQLAAELKNGGGEPLTGRAVTWTTSSSGVATVSGTGLVTAVGVGSATITAASEGKRGSAQITATASQGPVASVVVTPGTPTIASGGVVQLTATPKDANGQPLSGRAITWATSGAQVATVSSTGLVTGVAVGIATITATSEGQNGTATVTVSSLSRSALEGEWSGLIPSPVIQLHLHLLPDGRVLSWGLQGSPQLWDPASASFTAVASPALLFCSGHTFLSDGRLLVAGGHITSDHGLPATTIFDPSTGSWAAGAPMAQGRWYPTVTTLPNGEELALAGEDETGTLVRIPEIWNGSAWRQLTTATVSVPNYPRAFVAPDGRVFYAGMQQQSRWLQTSGTGAWSLGPKLNFGSRNYGSAVMYAPGKILFVGGGSPPTNTAEIIDLNQPNPQWTYTGSMTYPRWNLNATLLPTGDVLVTGGTSVSDRTSVAGAVNVAELWSPTTGGWTQLARSAPVLRGYHSTSLLLPDGRVIHSGGGDGSGTPNNFNYEVFSPPYLFRGPRPVIGGGVPSDVGYGQALALDTPDGASIAKVTLIRLGSVTHAFDQSQRLLPLSFSPTPSGLSVTLPASGNIAPPGPYMLFLVNSNGIPSVGQILRLR
jgi:WD40 repeat protein